MSAPTPANVTRAEACWDSFVQYPTYIRRERAVAAIALALDAAEQRAEARIVAWLRDEAGFVENPGHECWCDLYARLIEAGEHHKETIGSHNV